MSVWIMLRREGEGEVLPNVSQRDYKYARGARHTHAAVCFVSIISSNISEPSTWASRRATMQHTLPYIPRFTSEIAFPLPPSCS